MRRHRQLLFTAIVAGLLTAVAACEEDAIGPAGTVVLSLTTPNSDDGAALLTVTGRGLTNAQAASSGYRLYWRLHSDRELRVAVFGNLVSGPLLTLQTDDVGGVAVTLAEVASRSDSLRSSTSGYQVSVTTAAGQ